MGHDIAWWDMIFWEAVWYCMTRYHMEVEMREGKGGGGGGGREGGGGGGGGP